MSNFAPGSPGHCLDNIHQLPTGTENTLFGTFDKLLLLHIAPFLAMFLVFFFLRQLSNKQFGKIIDLINAIRCLLGKTNIPPKRYNYPWDIYNIKYI